MKAPCAGMQGKMLPSVTTEDNGDVLTVVDGEWSKASGGGGGGGVFVVNIQDGDEEGIHVLDKTAKQIKDATNNGQLIVFCKTGANPDYDIEYSVENYFLAELEYYSEGTYKCQIDLSDQTSYYAKADDEYPTDNPI